MIREVLTSVVDTLTAAGLKATDDPARFEPRPIACLVGVPDLQAQLLGAYQVSVPVYVVCGAPLTTTLRDALFMDALAACEALAATGFELTSWDGMVNATPLPAYRMTTTVIYNT